MMKKNQSEKKYPYDDNGKPIKDLLSNTASNWWKSYKKGCDEYNEGFRRRRKMLGPFFYPLMTFGALSVGFYGLCIYGDINKDFGKKMNKYINEAGKSIEMYVDKYKPQDLVNIEYKNNRKMVKTENPEVMSAMDYYKEAAINENKNAHEAVENYKKYIIKSFLENRSSFEIKKEYENFVKRAIWDGRIKDNDELFIAKSSLDSGNLEQYLSELRRIDYNLYETEKNRTENMITNMAINYVLNYSGSQQTGMLTNLELYAGKQLVKFAFDNIKIKDPNDNYVKSLKDYMDDKVAVRKDGTKIYTEARPWGWKYENGGWKNVTKPSEWNFRYDKNIVRDSRGNALVRNPSREKPDYRARVIDRQRVSGGERVEKFYGTKKEYNREVTRRSNERVRRDFNNARRDVGRRVDNTRREVGRRVDDAKRSVGNFIRGLQQRKK